jgi:hypothetical protein
MKVGMVLCLNKPPCLTISCYFYQSVWSIKLFIGMSFKIVLLTGFSVIVLLFATGSAQGEMLKELGSWSVFVVSLYLLVQLMGVAILAHVSNFWKWLRGSLGVLISIMFGLYMTVIFATMISDPNKVFKGVVTIILTYLAIFIFDKLPEIKDHFYSPEKPLWKKIDKFSSGFAIVLAVVVNIAICYIYIDKGLPIVKDLYM